MKKQQFGGTFAGILIGLVLGLAIAIAVAMAVSKMPMPFINTTANTRPGTLDAAEAERNRTWNPNAPLAGARGPAAVSNNTVAPAATTASSRANGADRPEPVPEPPSEVVTVAVPPSPPAATTPAPATNAPGTSGSGRQSSDPLGDLAAQLTRSSSPAQSPAATPPSASDSGNYQYFVQAGAFRAQGDADARRAQLAMMGWDARVTRRDQQGQTVYRVRVGPFNRSEDAAKLKQQLDGQSIDSAVVRQAR